MQSFLHNLVAMRSMKTKLNSLKPHQPYNNTLQAEADNFEARLVLNNLIFFDYSLPSLKPSQRLSFEEERAVENKSRPLALSVQLGRRL